MIRFMSDHVKRKGRQSEIVCVSHKEQTILDRLCNVTIACVGSSMGGVYVTIVYLYPDHERLNFATCNCKGYYFKSICGHIAAVLDIATKERV